MTNIGETLNLADTDENVEKPGADEPIGVLSDGTPVMLGDTLPDGEVLHLQCGDW